MTTNNATLRTIALALAVALAAACSDTARGGPDGQTPGDAADDVVISGDGRPDDTAPGDTAPGDGGTTDEAAPDMGSSPDGKAADSSSAAPLYPGQPAKGTLFWGAAVSGNGDPTTRHETPAGHILVIRRTFFQWSHRTGYMINIAKGDLAAGRLPWVSIKPPSWAAMAAGTYDVEIDQMLKALDLLKGPVWLTVHHEPEGGGGVNKPDDPAGPAGHLAMNKRVRARIKALKVDNVALAPILMSWTWEKASKRNPEDWWAPGVYDFLGVDHYQDAPKTLLNATWSTVRTWAAKKGVEVAVGEWGMRGTDAAAGQRVKSWYVDAANSHTDGKGARTVALCAFDSGLNAPTGSWELKGAQLTTFHSLLKDPRTADVASLP